MRWAFLMICCAVLRIRPVRNVHSGRVQLGRARFGLILTNSQKSLKREWQGDDMEQEVLKILSSGKDLGRYKKVLHLLNNEDCGEYEEEEQPQRK